mgnify:CR=1 FL=1
MWLPIPPYTPLPPDRRGSIKNSYIKEDKSCFPKNIKYTKNMFSEKVPTIEGMDHRVNKFISTHIPREHVLGSF